MKVFWTVIGVLLLIALAFCIVTLILASIHDVSFANEIKSWFDTAETTKEATNAALSIMFRK